MGQSRIRFACFLLIAFLAFVRAEIRQAASADVKLRRWAIIASDDVTETGLVDLLTVELSRDDKLELVERERLRDVLRELRLAALTDAKQVKQRLQLGKTLKADALLLLSLVDASGQRRIQVTACDCNLGVRLWHGEFVYADKSALEQLVSDCSATIIEVRKRYAGGVKHVIAVPPFFCENFALRFGHLQTRYRELLSNALMPRPGIVLVEIEEARAISRELETTLSDGVDRPNTTIVQARYRVAEPNRVRNRDVKLTIELVQRQSKSKSIEKTLPLDEVGSWLAKDLTNELLTSAQIDVPTLSADEQVRILTRHAQRFADLGDWRRSTSLRETVLVLNPQNHFQRALLVSEYQHSFVPAIDQHWHTHRFANKLPEGPRESGLRAAADEYVLAIEHLSYLIENRWIKRGDAMGIFGKQLWYKQHAVGAALPRDPLKFAALQPAIRAQREFVRAVYPLIRDLPVGRMLPDHISTPSYRGPYVVTTHVASDVMFNDYDAASVAALGELLGRVMPEKEPTSNAIIGVLTSSLAPDPGDENYDTWHQVLVELSKSPRETARLYGRLGLISESPRSGSSKAAFATLFDEVKQLGRADEPLGKMLTRHLTRPLPQPVRPLTAPLPRGNFGPLGRLELQPVKLVIENDEDATPPQIVGMLRCGAVDAYWSKDRFFVMHEPHVLRELKLTDATAKHNLFWGVSWDGECIWLHAHGQGIVAVRPDGTRVATFRNQLPGYWKGHKLIGISPRRALMVGCLGETHRAWCGLLEIDRNGRAKVNIFHEAKRVAAGRNKEEAAADPATAFQPDGLSRLRTSDGQDSVLVERRDLTPLQIDLATLEVTVPKQVAGVPGLSTLTDLGFTGRIFVRHGRAVHARSGVATTPNSKQMVFHDGWLYRPGLVWMRENADTGKLERLQAKYLPSTHWQLRAGSSAHFGLVTFDRQNTKLPLSRINILNETRRQSSSQRP